MQQHPFSFPEDDERVAYAMLVENYPAVLKSKERDINSVSPPHSVDEDSEPQSDQESAVSGQSHEA